MTQKIKVALSGYDAETDTDPNHFSLYVDPDEAVDYVLIKQFDKDTVTVSGGAGYQVRHDLGYVPFCLVFYEISPGRWRKCFSRPTASGGYFDVDEIFLNFWVDGNYSYYIFYDRIA